MAVGSWDVVKQKMILIDKRGVVNPLRDCAEELSTLTPLPPPPPPLPPKLGN